MNRKFIVMLLILFALALVVSCGKSNDDEKYVNVARSMENSAKSMAESANSMENSAKSIENSAKSMVNLASSNVNANSANTNANISNSSVSKSSPTPYTSSRESSVTSMRNAECIRQRTAAGLDTSPCSEWAEER